MGVRCHLPTRLAGFALCFVLGACLAKKAAFDTADTSTLVRVERHHAAMGTRFHLVMFAESVAVADAAAKAAWERVDDIEAVSTDYDPASEARRLGERSAEWVRVSRDLALVLRAADAAWERTGGAFDPTVGSWSKMWRRALRRREWPSDAAWKAATATVGWRERVQLRDGVQAGAPLLQVRVASPVRLDFGGIAKGVAVDEALGTLRAHGVTRALMDGGGDLAALEPPPGEPGWKVEVRAFGEASNGKVLRFLLTSAAIATSGDAYQGATLAGQPPLGVENLSSRFGHVLDPRSLQPLPGPRAAIATAATATEADALATAMLVIGDTCGDPERYSSRYEGLRRGIFFASTESDPCVGDLFPHDGARPTRPNPARTNE